MLQGSDSLAPACGVCVEHEGVSERLAMEVSVLMGKIIARRTTGPMSGVGLS